MRCAVIGCFNEAAKGQVFCRLCGSMSSQKALSETSRTDTVIHYETPGEEIERLLKENLALRQEAGKWKSKYDQLNIIYNKLADQWNAFQALSKPDNRNIQRAEGAGEMARKLAEVLLGVAYSTDVRDILRKLLDDMEGAGGQEVEVGGKMVKHRG